MKRTTKILTAGLAAGAGVFAIAVLAHPHGPGAFARGMGGHHSGHGGWHGKGAHKGGEHRGMRRMFKRLKRMDADNNGEVTEAEFLRRRQDRFALLDADNSNSLSGNELVSQKIAHREWRGRRFVKRLDANKDGKVSKDEMLSAAKARFMANDLDGDGKITRSDLPPKSRRHDRNGRDERSDDQSSAASDEIASDEAKDDREHRGKHHRKRHGKFHRWFRRHHHAMKSLEDVEKRVTRRFEHLDRNKDGYVEANEFGPRRQDRLEFAKRKRMHRLDTNKDGTVSKDEFLEKARKRFAVWDLDDSGSVTGEDLPPALARKWNEK
ncbi:MAG: EF-hand domain-containing protein [Hyphomicrobiaceae bacterium]